MLRLPVLFYYINNTGWLDPVVPFGCPEADTFEEKLGSQRLVYDLSLLEKLLRKAAPLLYQIAESMTIGSVWQFGDLEGTERRFANSNGSLGRYRDLIPYRHYVRGRSKMTSHMTLTRFSLVAPRARARARALLRVKKSAKNWSNQ